MERRKGLADGMKKGNRKGKRGHKGEVRGPKRKGNGKQGTDGKRGIEMEKWRGELGKREKKGRRARGKRILVKKKRRDG